MSEYIKRTVDEIVILSGTRKPFDLADYLDINVKRVAGLRTVLGFYHVVLGRPYIFINDNLSEPLKEMVLSHEIGHHLLHREMFGENPHMETELFSNLKMEREANEFAAHLLVDDEAVHRVLEGSSIMEVASEYSLMPELIIYKLNYLNKMNTDIEVCAELREDFWKV